jgi:hypothetical protein
MVYSYIGSFVLLSLQKSRGHPAKTCHWDQYFHLEVGESGQIHCHAKVFLTQLGNLTIHSLIWGLLA